MSKVAAGQKGEHKLMSKQPSTASQLTKMISDLKQERQGCVQRIDEIDQTFKALGLPGSSKARAASARKTAPSGQAKRAKKAPAAAAKKRLSSAKKAPAAAAKKRLSSAKKATKQSMPAKKMPGEQAAAPKRGKGAYKQTGREFVMSALQRCPLTTAELRAQWKRAGRGGQSDNSVTDLVKGGKIRRSEDPTKRGSIYSLIASASMNATAASASASP
jgi:hypothetical protein